GILVVGMFAGTASGDEQPKKSSDELNKTGLKAIRGLLESIEKKVGSIDTVKSDVGGLKKEIELMRQANGGAFTDINQRISQLEGKLKALESRLDLAQTRVANFPPTNSAQAPPPTGRIRLVNN